LPEGCRSSAHTHEQDEVIYLIEGELTMILGGERINAKAGSLAYIPSGCVHSFRIDSEEARLLNFYLPGGFERVITDFGVPAEARVIPPAGLKSTGTPEQMKALFQRVGMNTVALPDSLLERKRN
jgi:uncharacterized protein YjlB